MGEISRGVNGEAGKASSVNWRELVERTASKTGLSKAQVDRVLEAFVEVASEAIAAPGSVKLKRIGTLSAEWRDGRVLRSPRDQKRMFLDGRFQLAFRPSDSVKQELANRSPQHWKSAEHQGAWRLAETLLSDLELYHADKVPKAITGKTSDADITALCESAFGVHWRRVLTAWEAGVPEAVRASRDYLAHCARVRWSGRRN